MSIIKPHRERRFLLFFLSLCLLAGLAGGTYVASYRSFADDRHEIERLEKEIISLEAANVTLTERAVVTTDPGALESLAAARGLSLDRRPVFLTLGSAD